MGLSASGQAAQGYKARAPRVPAQSGHRADAPVLRSLHTRPEGQDASHRLSASGRQGLEAGPCHGYSLPRLSSRVHGRGTPRENPRLP